MRRVVTGLLLLLVTVAAQARDAAELQLALRKLTVVGSALYIAAHPDDENTAMLAWLANQKLVRTGYLATTRGDGGQNLIGNEKGELLGVIRTQELLAARRVDGAEQFFTRAIDFGYTKSPTETLELWNDDRVLADMVWIIRRFQPDVIITRFPTTGEGGHGQHTASAILAEAAFKAAGDPTRFPEQLQSVGVWQPTRLFWNRFSWQRIDPADPLVANDIRVDLGTYNPLLGRAYTEIAAESRSQHKSQGFGSAERRGSVVNYFKQTSGDPAKSELFEGIDLSWSRYPGGQASGKTLQQAADTFDPANPEKSLPLLLEALDQLNRLGATEPWAARTNPWIEVKRQELLEAIRLSAGIAIDVSAADSSVVPGGEIPVSVTVVNRSNYPFMLSAVASPFANPGKAPGAALKNNQPVKTDISIRVPADSSYSQPYWLRERPGKGLFGSPEQNLAGKPENPAAVPITVTLDDDRMHTLIFTVPAVFRRTDPVRGEVVRTVGIVPEITANIDSTAFVFPDAKPKSVTLRLQTFAGAGTATVRLLVPNNWKVTPPSAEVRFEHKGDEVTVSFLVTPPATPSNGTARAEVELPGGRKISYALTTIDYEHIPPQRLFPPAEAKLVRVNLQKRGSMIGYIMGSGDEVPAALRQVGYQVALLTDAELAAGDFARFDAIIAGVRAYNTRDALRHAQSKLMQYVENGGTYVVQYNTTDDLVAPAMGPWPFKISRDRVTVEEAPVKMIDPDHPLLSKPNRITAADFDGWVQERGLNFTAEADPKYQTVLSSADPGEEQKAGGELYARYGKGVFIYTSYAWFRQLPAGVPGAYRLFANMVSAK